MKSFVQHHMTPSSPFALMQRFENGIRSHRMLAKPREESGHVHHPEVRMALYSWLSDAERRITL